MSNDGLGDRCKDLEQREASRAAMRGLPLLARLDGRAFHTFTRGLTRPYDPAMSRCMIETARTLVEETQARVAYTQSDEITLAWYEPADAATTYLFDGRWQKLGSVLAGLASARFNQLVAEHLPAKAALLPHFDCRLWQVPTLTGARCQTKVEMSGSAPSRNVGFWPYRRASREASSLRFSSPKARTKSVSTQRVACPGAVSSSTVARQSIAAR